MNYICSSCGFRADEVTWFQRRETGAYIDALYSCPKCSQVVTIVPVSEETSEKNPEEEPTEK